MTRLLLSLIPLLFLGLAAGPTAAQAIAPEPTAAQPGTGGARGDGAPDKEGVQLSFKGANITQVVEWLAKMTGKSIIKHKDVKCKLDILSSKKVPVKEAVRLVYKALAMEGYSALENNRVIMIVPEKMETKVSAELVDGKGGELPGGKTMVIRVFDIKHTDLAKLKDRIKPVLSAKAKVEVDDQAGKLIVTDYSDNVRFLEDVLEQLDVPAQAETATRVFPLKHTRADDLATLLSAVFSGGGKPTAKKPTRPKKPVKAKSTAPTVILADKASNRLVVTAPPKKMPEIENLIQILDTEKPADVAVRLIPLRNVDARELVDEIGRLYQKMKGSTLKETIEISAVARANALIVLSSEANFQGIQEIAKALDTEEGTDKTMKAFKLEFADCEEVAKQLEELHQTRDDSYSYYSFRRRSSKSQYGKVRFVANRRQNEVIAIGPPGSLDRIGEMIVKLDLPAGEENLAPRIYPLKYVAAKDIEEVLNELFKKTERRNYWWDEVETDNKDIGRLYGKVRFASEPYSNSIIVTTNSDENFDAVERLLKQLDVRSEEREATLNFPLRYAKAVNVANNINILFAGPGSPPRRGARQPNQPANRGGTGDEGPSGFELGAEDAEETFFPWLGSQQQGRNFRGRVQARPVSDLVGKVRIVPDNRTNSLMITTSPHFFPQIIRVVKDLDIPTAQVLIEAKILEVSRDDRERFGVRWTPDGNRVLETEDFDGSLLPTGGVEYSEVFSGTVLENAMRTGLVDAAVNLDVLIQFLVKKTHSRVRAEPRINVADNERGKLFVGARIPFIDRTLTTTEGGQNSTFKYTDVGITLEVTPHINHEGEVTLKIRVEASQIRPGETLFGGAIIDTRNYRTELTVSNGQTLVLGGILQREKSEVVRKVPLLGDIPIVGWLFKKQDTVVKDVELMVFLKPTVTRSPEDVVKLMQSERDKTPQIHEFAPDLVEKAPPARPRIKVVTW